MNKLKELYEKTLDLSKGIQICCDGIREEFQKYTEINMLLNTITNLSNSDVALALNDVILEIAYASPEPNLEVRKYYLKEAITDLLSGMYAIDVIWKFDRILYWYKGGRL